ncbi:unnamed protein product, partial [Musa hybrid cultivar]
SVACAFGSGLDFMLPAHKSPQGSLHGRRFTDSEHPNDILFSRSVHLNRFDNQ